MTKTTENFDRWWAIYPRRQSKGDALRAWTQVDGEEQAELIIKATKAYPFTDEKQYIKLPATWLRSWCFLDEFDTGDSDNDW